MGTMGAGKAGLLLARFREGGGRAMSTQRFSAGVIDSRNGKCILSSNRGRGARISPSYLAGYFHNTSPLRMQVPDGLVPQVQVRQLLHRRVDRGAGAHFAHSGGVVYDEMVR